MRWVTIVALASAMQGGPLLAQDEKTIAQHYAEAGPVLHHSCQSLVLAHQGNEEGLLEDIARLVAVSVINRGIDMTNPNRSAEEEAEIRAEFFDELGDRCRLDENALIAGVIDGIVADLARIY
ncbi:MAG: hypothetical protein AAFR46_10700 [Pseudomonadota bacterium]